MKRRTLASVFALMLTAALVALAPSVGAQTGGIYDLTWNTIDGGGSTNAGGGSFGLSGTIGQAEAGTLSGGSYTLNGGFWIGTAGTIEYKVYLPLVLKNL